MRYCGRQFTVAELEGIRALIAEDPKRGRVALSQRVCQSLSWYKPDGGLKEMSCRVALLRMQADGLIRLPPPQRKNGNGTRYARRTPAAEPRLPVVLEAACFPQLRLEVVAAGKDSALWNEYIARYHYLGYRSMAGAQLRYWVRYHTEELACLGFGASAWTLAPRDRFIGWSDEQRQRRLPWWATLAS